MKNEKEKDLVFNTQHFHVIIFIQIIFQDFHLKKLIIILKYIE